MASINSKRNIDSMLLAILRTELANRRTFLAYIKTSLGIGITGLGLLKLTETQSIYAAIGTILIPVSLITLIIGITDFHRTKKKIEEEKKDAKV